MCVCVRVCVYIYIYAYIYVYTRVSTSKYTHIHIYMKEFKIQNMQEQLMHSQAAAATLRQDVRQIEEREDSASQVVFYEKREREREREREQVRK